eukprot:2309091-Karenia_brevis.AAC.1
MTNAGIGKMRTMCVFIKSVNMTVMTIGASCMLPSINMSGIAIMRFPNYVAVLCTVEEITLT